LVLLLFSAIERKEQPDGDRDTHLEDTAWDKTLENCGRTAGHAPPQLHGYQIGCSFLSDDKQGRVRRDIEDQKDDFEQPKERVNDHVEGFSGNGKPFALRAVHQIRSQSAHCGPEDQQNSVYDDAPHEKSCQRLNIHDLPFLSVSIQRYERGKRVTLFLRGSKKRFPITYS
jgi:hypothetical protein